MAVITVGFIGTGAMGEHMCRNIAKKGTYSVIAFDLSSYPLQRLANNGVVIAETAMDAAVKSNVLILSLPGGPEVASLAHNTLLSPKLRGLTIIDMSTTPVKLTREIATKFDKMGIKFLDAPVARTQQAAIDGDLSIMVGGDQELLEKYRDVLLCMGPDISHCGPTGCGQIAKILNNMVVFQNGLALAEALTIGKEAGMDEGLLLDIINKSSGASFVGMNHGVKAMVPGKFPLKQFPARYALKDLSYALQLADEGGVVVPGAELVGKMLKKAIDIGNGDEYWPTIIKTVENNNK
ncbi:MAG: NAD(P)-dependent oxidoreductase [Rhodospirillaceae bacterium]|nr:NAD(P)-dependent oxidoreductase [Rhodospirillaceae bacterium]MBT6307109.1 NAD(P)-dependent oxidoreductase [Rhodospirillaceae bacterium]MBT7732208.1 NAD(P)-dependent oxidoreductase [Rhodospirillaceae bacterium]MDC1441094.1 NAD(P)-dependent oxidoreductase [Rhodospirillaceae bacterium]